MRGHTRHCEGDKFIVRIHYNHSKGHTVTVRVHKSLWGSQSIIGKVTQHFEGTWNTCESLQHYYIKHKNYGSHCQLLKSFGGLQINCDGHTESLWRQHNHWNGYKGSKGKSDKVIMGHMWESYSVIVKVTQSHYKDNQLYWGHSMSLWGQTKLSRVHTFVVEDTVILKVTCSMRTYRVTVRLFKSWWREHRVILSVHKPYWGHTVIVKGI